MLKTIPRPQSMIDRSSNTQCEVLATNDGNFIPTKPGIENPYDKKREQTVISQPLTSIIRGLVQIKICPCLFDCFLSYCKVLAVFLLVVDFVYSQSLNEAVKPWICHDSTITWIM